MPYKRRLRLLWVALDHPEWAREACETGGPPSAGSIDHRSGGSSRDLAWADLVITLDGKAKDSLPRMEPRTQVRHLDLAGAADAVARRALVEARVAGIVGGLKLLDRIKP